uniref:Uncharacterized protein n=1 Tax=Anguilla anguilla TaxID=7936 RepID=A0A0E9ST82_ANGAN
MSNMAPPFRFLKSLLHGAGRIV